MHTLTATEASRSFASLLDEAEQGRTIVITRGGRRIATIGPASASNGLEFLSLLTSSAVDKDFATDARAAREAVTLEDPAWSED
jgi:prevent-host-death family protein